MKKFYVALVFVVLAGVLRAQAPGGVSGNLSLWLKPDGLVSGPLSTWVYANNGSNQFSATAPNQPTVVTNAFNFLPAVSFNNVPNPQFMSGPTGTPGAPLPLGQLAYAVIAVWSSPTPTGPSGPNMRVWAQRPNSSAADGNFDGASLFVYPNAANGGTFGSNGPTYGNQFEVSPYVSGVNFTNEPVAPFTYSNRILTYAPNTTYISMMNLSAADVSDLQLMDQTNYASGGGVTSSDPAGTATAAGHRANLSDQANLLGARSTLTTGTGDETFVGNLAELIIYTTTLSTLQQQQIFSYLSLKYGIPLNGNYLSSSGATIWDATAGGGAYNNFVFGLGQDNASGLSVSTSNSSATGSGSGAGTSNMANITLSSPSSPSNQQFMIVGSNNAGTAQSQSNVPIVANGSWRLNNQWLVQNTGTVGTVNVAVDLTGVDLTASGSTLGTSSEFRLVTDNDGDGNFISGTQSYYTPTSWTSGNNVANFTGVNLSNSSNVVFTVLTNASGGTPLPVNWVNFTAVPNGGNVNLNWTVGANQEAKVYQVQRSADGTNFTNIGQVANDPDEQSYSYVDASVGSGTYYYRVLEVDLGGASIYSKIVSVNMSGAAFAIKLLNNPTVTGNTDPELQVTTNASGNALMEVWTLSGSRVGSFQQALGAGTTTVRVPLTSLAAGTYAVKVMLNNNTQTVQVVKL